MDWYTTVNRDLASIPDFILHYENELGNAKRDVGVFGNIEKNLASLPGVTEHRFNQFDSSHRAFPAKCIQAV